MGGRVGASAKVTLHHRRAAQHGVPSDRLARDRGLFEAILCGALAAVDLTPRQLLPHEYHELLSYGIGLTDLAKSHAGMDSDIQREGFDPAAFQAKIQYYHPQFVAFTSKKTGQV
jgi:hypothetical protein